MRHTLPIACALALGLTACGFKVEQKDPPVNPAPIEAYRFEVWVEDPPRPMRVEKMTAWYGTENCLPRQPISGVYAVSANFPVVVDFEAQGEDRYATTVYDDLLLPSDLYGEGICRWRLSNVEVMWSDGALMYRHWAHARALSGKTGVTYTAFPRASRGWPDPGSSLPLAASVAFGDYSGEFPSATARDTSSPYFEPQEADSRVPLRQTTPELDFLLLSQALLPEGTAEGQGAIAP